MSRRFRSTEQRRRQEMRQTIRAASRRALTPGSEPGRGGKPPYRPIMDSSSREQAFCFSHSLSAVSCDI